MKSHLSLWDIAEGRARTILTVDHRIEAPNWYPSGDAILVNSDGRLYRVPLDRPALEPLDIGFDARCNNDHGISPDGRTIVFCAHRGHGAEMFMIPATGGAARRINDKAPSWWHSWSPDGRTLAFVAARGGSRVVDVYTMPATGGPETRLTFGEGHSDGPDFSHDGRLIYWNCDRDGHAQIWVMQADGSDQRTLFADDRVNWFPHPSPCGTHLLYLSYPPGTQGHPADLPVALVLCRPDGSDRRRILECIGGQGTMNVPNWAPDGHAFAFVRYTP